jgi:hypothetical protein
VKEKNLPNPRSNRAVRSEHAKRNNIAKSKNATRSVRSFHPNTISIPADETIGIFEGKVTYTEVIDGLTGDTLGVPNMDVVRETMRPTNDPACRLDGEYYIANFRTPAEQEEFERSEAAAAHGLM